MSGADVVIKCEEFIDNEVHPDDENNSYFNIYESHGDTEPENDENRRDDIDYANDDIKMQELLREFDLEILFTILKLGDITYRSLKYISENDINAAIRSIAYRAEFREKLFAWRRDKYGLNDLSVLPPPKTSSSAMPLGVNNSNNILTHNTNTYNTNAPSRVTPSPYDHITTTTTTKTTTTNTKQQPPGIAPRTRRLSTPKTNSAKKPRISTQAQERQTKRTTTNSSPPSPTPTASRSMTSPTPTLSDTMSLLQQDSSRMDSHPSMDFDDPLCYQPTTSSAAAAATQPTGSMKSETSASTYAQPKMAFEKLCLETTKKRNRGCTEYVWSKAKTLQLIELFQLHQDLWNPTAEFYRNYSHKQGLLCEISTMLDIDVDEIAAKIHNLRCQYNAVLRTMRKQRKIQGSRGSYSPEPRWEFYSALKFLSAAKEYNSKHSAKADATFDAFLSTDSVHVVVPF